MEHAVFFGDFFGDLEWQCVEELDKEPPSLRNRVLQISRLDVQRQLEPDVDGNDAIVIGFESELSYVQRLARSLSRCGCKGAECGALECAVEVDDPLRVGSTVFWRQTLAAFVVDDGRCSSMRRQSVDSGAVDRFVGARESHCGADLPVALRRRRRL